MSIESVSETLRPLLSRREVADLLGVSTRSVARYTEDGYLPCVRLPSGTVRYRPEDVDAFIAEAVAE